MKPLYFAAKDMDYYPDILLFDDEAEARAKFNEMVTDHAHYAAQNSNRPDKKGQVHFGMVLRSHPMGQPLAEEFWKDESEPFNSGVDGE